MRVVEALPRPIRVHENVWIPLPDGTRLAARLWLPADAERRPVPALVEYLPYRKRDRTRGRDEPIHRYFAGHGYASLRVDLRGTGDSDGLLDDEYLPQEQLDGAAVIGWLARQPWCTGAVGMIGKSWGGFNALQIAALRPPALKAVVSVCSTDDRYADDAHYMGGCLLNENLIWGTQLMALVAQPPDPALVGPGWRDAWRRRLAHARPFPAVWMRHRRRDDYWRHGSVCEDPAAIACPVFLVGGWADAYTDAIPRLLAGLSVPRRGLIGPWGHVYPHLGTPGPAIGFLQECLAWWDRWLQPAAAGDAAASGAAAGDAAGDPAGDAAGAAAGDAGAEAGAPLLRAWMPDPVGGRWVAEETWPPERAPLWLDLDVGDGSTPSAGRLVPPPPGPLPDRSSDRPPDRPPGSASATPTPGVAGATLTHRSAQTVGAAAGVWCRFGHPDDAPGDQHPDDAGSLCFDGPPLPVPLELLGAPVARLHLSVDRPVAHLAVRLCDVAPDGRSERIGYGLLDLAARYGFERAEPVMPGAPLVVDVPLSHAAHHLAAGHRLRLAVSTSYWPIMWPSPDAVTLTLFAEGSRLSLPARPPRRADERLPPLGPPEAAPPPPQTDLQTAPFARRFTRDPHSGELRLEVLTGMGPDGVIERWREDDIDLEVATGMRERFAIGDDDPLSARAEVEHVAELRRGDWAVRIETRTRLTGDADNLRLEAEQVAWEGGAEVSRREWDLSLPREG